MEELVKSLSKEYSCILILGPRQVGKSTMLDHIDNARSKVTLDDLEERNLARTDPEMFLKIHIAPLTIDEVQYAPELFSYIKIAIDNGAKSGSYYLTGSQSYELMKLAEESLAGRVAILNLSPLSQHELFGGSRSLVPFEVNIDNIQSRVEHYEKTDVNGIFQRIWNGGLPALVSKKYSNRDIYYSSYLQTYLLRDVKEETTIKNDIKFVDFVRAVACRIGQELNVHSIAVDTDISDDTARRWLFLLEKSQIIFRLHPYSGNLLKRVVKNPKLYFFDTGLVCYLTRHSSAEILQNSSINGAILENYVVSEIRKSYLNAGIEPYMYYYRDKDQREIDLVLEYDRALHMIEIKKSSAPTLSMVKNFDVIKKTGVEVGRGAIICMKDTLSAINADILIVPTWCV